MKRCVLMRVKDEKEDIITRSERVQERHKNGTALRVVSFSRERRLREGGREIVYRFHIIVSKIQTRETNVPKTKTSSSSSQQTRSKQRERKKEHVYNRIPGDGVKFHKLLASPTFGPCSAIICVTSSFYEENEHNAREAKRERFEGGI